MNNISNQIKNINLADLVRYSGVELRQRGNKWVGLCPLHQEKTPSFYVYADNHWWCFGACGCGGDAADLIQALYRCDFSEALRHLCIDHELSAAEKAEIKSQQKLKAKRIQRERDLIYTLAMLIRAAHKSARNVDLLPAWEYWHDILARGSKAEKQEIVDGLKSWTTISRNYLFRPEFNYRRWLNNFYGRGGPETGEENATASNKNQIRTVSAIHS